MICMDGYTSSIALLLYESMHRALILYIAVSIYVSAALHHHTKQLPKIICNDRIPVGLDCNIIYLY